MLDPLLAVSEGELNTYKARGQRVLSFDWAIDSFLGELEGRTEENYEIVGGRPGPVKAEVKEEASEGGPAEDVDPPVPAAAPVPGLEEAAEGGVPVEDEPMEQDIEMGDGADEL